MRRGHVDLHWLAPWSWWIRTTKDPTEEWWQGSSESTMFVLQLSFFSVDSLAFVLGKIWDALKLRIFWGLDSGHGCLIFFNIATVQCLYCWDCLRLRRAIPDTRTSPQHQQVEILGRCGEVQGALHICIYKHCCLLAQAVSKVKILLSPLRMTMPTALSFFRSFLLPRATWHLAQQSQAKPQPSQDEEQSGSRWRVTLAERRRADSRIHVFPTEMNNFRQIWPDFSSFIAFWRFSSHQGSASSWFKIQKVMIAFIHGGGQDNSTHAFLQGWRDDLVLQAEQNTHCGTMGRGQEQLEQKKWHRVAQKDTCPSPTVISNTTHQDQC